MVIGRRQPGAAGQCLLLPARGPLAGLHGARQPVPAVPGCGPGHGASAAAGRGCPGVGAILRGGQARPRSGAGRPGRLPGLPPHRRKARPAPARGTPAPGLRGARPPLPRRQRGRHLGLRRHHRCRDVPVRRRGQRPGRGRLTGRGVPGPATLLRAERRRSRLRGVGAGLHVERAAGAAQDQRHVRRRCPRGGGHLVSGQVLRDRVLAADHPWCCRLPPRRQGPGRHGHRGQRVELRRGCRWRGDRVGHQLPRRRGRRPPGGPVRGAAAAHQPQSARQPGGGPPEEADRGRHRALRLHHRQCWRRLHRRGDLPGQGGLRRPAHRGTRPLRHQRGGRAGPRQGLCRRQLRRPSLGGLPGRRPGLPRRAVGRPRRLPAAGARPADERHVRAGRGQELRQLPDEHRGDPLRGAQRRPGSRCLRRQGLGPLPRRRRSLRDQRPDRAHVLRGGRLHGLRLR